MADRVLITGARGFIGAALVQCLKMSGYHVRRAVRRIAGVQDKDITTDQCQTVTLCDGSTERQIEDACRDVQVIVHLAARVHVMADPAPDALEEFQRINVRWTERLARAAAMRNVRRFVYMSSIKVNGERTDYPFTEEDNPRPVDPYGRSKWEAEQILRTISDGTGLQTVIVRSPLVYGPGVRGNFLKLLNAVRSRIPLPLAAIRNRRSLIYCGNLVDALASCVRHHRAGGRVYLVSDGRDLSTPELIRALGRAMGEKVSLWALPPSVLRAGGRIAGRSETIDRLIESLQVDSSRIRRELDWEPPYSVEQGLEDTAMWFRSITAPSHAIH